MNESVSIVVAFLTGVAGPIIVTYVKHYLDKKKPDSDMVEEAIEVSKLINDKIDDIKEDFNCDRVWIAQFHNGGHFYPTGKSIAKFSIFNEVVSIDTSSIQTNFQSIPVNLFSKVINELLENDIVSIYDFKDLKTTSYGLRNAAEASGCKSAYLFSIKSIEGKFIGILGIDYTKRKTKLNPEELNLLLNQATAVGGVLMTHLQKK
jgi:hypothetical protein